MATPQQVLFTAEDYKNLPETGPRCQLVEGDLIAAPAPNRYHQDISRNLEFILCGYLKEHPIGKVYDAPFDVYLDDHNVFQPDILFVSKERAGILIGLAPRHFGRARQDLEFAAVQTLRDRPPVSPILPLISPPASG
jgi:Uma2 family endonuclease